MIDYSNLKKEKRIVAEILKGKEFNTVLEVGCQWGENLVGIQDEFDGKKLVGIDIDTKTLEETNLAVRGIQLMEGNATELQFPNKSFDVVFTQAVFCMMKTSDFDKVMKEIIRVAKKYIILVELDTLERIGFVGGKGRVGYNWIDILVGYGLDATKEKIPYRTWSVQPWATRGYVITIEL